MTSVAANHDPARFAHQGYCILQQTLPAGLIAQVDGQLGRLLGGLTPGQRPERLVEPHVLAEDWRFWLELCRHPYVLDAVASCLRCEELLLLMSHLIVKPAGDGLEVAWHQDNTYWPSVHGTDVVTVWLAIDDTDCENSCMHVIPCTHAGYPALEKIPTAGGDLLNVTVAVSPEMAAAAVPVELRSGQISVHDSFIIHGSSANRSHRRRAGYTMRYANAATVDIDTRSHNKPVYYLRGDGSRLRDDYLDLRPGVAPPQDSGRDRRNQALELLDLHRKR